MAKRKPKAVKHVKRKAKRKESFVRVRVTDKLLRALKRYARAEGITQSDAARKALQAFITKQEAKAAQASEPKAKAKKPAASKKKGSSGRGKGRTFGEIRARGK